MTEQREPYRVPEMAGPLDLAAVLTRIITADRERINASATAHGQAGQVEVVVLLDVSTRMRRVDVRVPGQGVRTFQVGEAA